MRNEFSVRASARTCQTWLTKDWSSSGALYTAEAVEEKLGTRLRLDQYVAHFQSETSARILSELLAESQPPHQVSANVLRSWYIKYHPQAGPLRYSASQI